MEIKRFTIFGLIGTLAFVVDASVLKLLVYLFSLDLYSARLCSFFVAVNTTWILNRNITFRDRQGSSLANEWVGFFIANSGGGVINYTAYIITLSLWSISVEYPVIAVATGSIAGLFFNFITSSKFVFTKQT